jgi:hypothetical protein
MFKKGMFFRISWEILAVSIILLAIVTLFSLFSTPTVFSGRDQGAISEAAVRLVQNHTLEFSTPASTEFFKIYGPGRALNFPGFYYTSQGNLVTQFPLVYIAWLALFYALFGVTGFIVANAILLFIFFLSFYLLARMFLKVFPSLATLFFTATSFVFMWFLKFTLSENMALPLLWVSILTLMLFLKNTRKLYFAVFISSLTLLFFTRIEGIAFLAVSILILFLHKHARKHLIKKPLIRIILPIGIFLAVFIANIIKDFNFYREIAKALFSEISKNPQANNLSSLSNLSSSVFYFEKIFYLYGLLGFFIIGAIGVGFYFYKKDIYKLLPFFIVSPTLIYFFSSQISPDHPWLLRRFMFSLLPAAILYCGLLLGHKFEKKSSPVWLAASGIIAFVLLAGNLPAFSRYLFFSENKDLLKQTGTFSSNFSSNSLILIDREAAADGWNMISGPMSFLYGKNAVYFFNPQDLEKLQLDKFSNVYLVVSNSQLSRYFSSPIGNRLMTFGSYNFVSLKLNVQQGSLREIISLPAKEKISVSGKVFKIN